MLHRRSDGARGLSAVWSEVQGVDLVWESVGGEMFETCVRALANGGRLIVIGTSLQFMAVTASQLASKGSLF